MSKVSGFNDLNVGALSPLICFNGPRPSGHAAVLSARLSLEKRPARFRFHCYSYSTFYASFIDVLGLEDRYRGTPLLANTKVNITRFNVLDLFRYTRAHAPVTFAKAQ